MKASSRRCSGKMLPWRLCVTWGLSIRHHEHNEEERGNLYSKRDGPSYRYGSVELRSWTTPKPWYAVVIHIQGFGTAQELWHGFVMFLQGTPELIRIREIWSTTFKWIGTTTSTDILWYKKKSSGRFESHCCDSTDFLFQERCTRSTKSFWPASTPFKYTYLLQRFLDCA